MNHILQEIIENNRECTASGHVATYIPELSKADPNDLGIYIVTLDNEHYSAGEANKKFTIQSISKIITLMLALVDNGIDTVFTHIGVEPSGESFSSIASMETRDLRKPYNPMINAGAILASSLIKGDNVQHKVNRILDFTRKLAHNDDISINESTFHSEKITGDKNRALAYYMKSCNLMQGDVDEILDIYFSHCSIEITCKDLAEIGAVLANDGVSIHTGEPLISKQICRITKTIMVTCGLYDASGDFAVHIGIPAKSGVGGGILASVPKKMGIGVFAPALDSKGNPVAGIGMLKDISNELDLSIF